MQAIRSLIFLKFQDPEIGRWLAYTLSKSRSEEIVLEALKALFQMQQPPQQMVRQIIMKRNLLKHGNTQIREIGKLFFLAACGGLDLFYFPIWCMADKTAQYPHP